MSAAKASQISAAKAIEGTAEGVNRRTTSRRLRPHIPLWRLRRTGPPAFVPWRHAHLARLHLAQAIHEGAPIARAAGRFVEQENQTFHETVPHKSYGAEIQKL